MDLIQAIILGVIEGLTEFLPVSSTGHMILAATVMNLQDEEFVGTFEIVIQLGAILSVLTLYYQRFLVSTEIYKKLLVAFLPSVIVGYPAYKLIKHYLLNAWVVSVALIAGGIVLIFVDRWMTGRDAVYSSTEKMSYRGCVQIGLFQAVSMVPGVSRAGATIIGGVASGFSRQQAAEFSFLLAIPTMVAATSLDLYESSATIEGSQWALLAIGGIVAFFSALVAVKAFVAFLTRHGFRLFGYYRIVLGLGFLAYAWLTDLKLPDYMQ